MPQVPTLTGNQVQQNELNVGRVPTESPGRSFFGGGESVSQVAQASKKIQKVVEEEQNKADQIAVLEADQQLSALETDMLYNRETGAMTKKGKDSFSLPDTVLPDFEQRAGEIENSLSNDYQKASFRKMMADRSKHINSQIQRHVFKESQEYDESVTKSYIANEMNAVMESFHDPERIKLGLERQRGAILSYADRNGVDPETRKRLLEENQSKNHSAVVTKLLNGGANLQAKQYYQSNKDMITGEDRLRVEKALKEGVLISESQSKADQIMAKTDNMSEALEMARNISDPDKRDEVVKRVKIRFADERAAKEDEERRSFQVAYDAVEENHTIDSIPKDILANLSLKSKQALEKRAAQLRNGLPVETDIATYYDLENMAGNSSTRNKFLRLNLLEYKHKLSESDFKHFAKLQGEAKSGNKKELDGIQTKGNIVKSALAAAGIEVGKNAGSDDIKRANAFQRRVDELVVEKQELTGKKVTNEELREITENLMVETIVGNSWFGLFDDKKRVFELSSEDQPVVKIDDIPPGELEAIKATLNKLNIPNTPQNQLELYTEKLNRLRGGNG